MKTTTLRLPEDLLKRIDKARGLIPRERWIRAKLEEALEREERKAAKR